MTRVISSQSLQEVAMPYIFKAFLTKDEKDSKEMHPHPEKGYEKPPYYDYILPYRLEASRTEELGTARAEIEERLAGIEQAVRELRHFIRSEDRPDLSGGALSNEE
jgi:hypothetical protein